MAYNKARAEKKWLKWKEAEEMNYLQSIQLLHMRRTYSNRLE